MRPTVWSVGLVPTVRALDRIYTNVLLPLISYARLVLACFPIVSPDL